MLKITEIKEDVKFLEDEKGNLYQQINEGEVIKVKDGSISYKRIKTVKGYTIKYELNGCAGFSIWKGNTNLEDRIWSISEAERIANEM